MILKFSVKMVNMDYEIKLIILKSSSECSAQVQVPHCKRRNLGCSSAEGKSSTAKSGTKAAVLLKIE